GIRRVLRPVRCRQKPGACNDDTNERRYTNSELLSQEAERQSVELTRIPREGSREAWARGHAERDARLGNSNHEVCHRSEVAERSRSCVRLERVSGHVDVQAAQAHDGTQRQRQPEKAGQSVPASFWPESGESPCS